MAKGRKIGPGKNFTHTSDTETQFKVNQTPSVQGSTDSDLVKSKRTGPKWEKLWFKHRCLWDLTKKLWFKHGILWDLTLSQNTLYQPALLSYVWQRWESGQARSKLGLWSKHYFLNFITKVWYNVELLTKKYCIRSQNSKGFPWMKYKRYWFSEKEYMVWTLILYLGLLWPYPSTSKVYSRSRTAHPSPNALCG